jgi:hypothetical protein
VRVVDPGDEAIEVTRCEWAESADVCIARGRSQGVLSLLAAAEAVPGRDQRFLEDVLGVD